MNHFDQNSFYQFIIENKVISFRGEPVVLHSEIKSHLYVNWREITDDVFLLDQLTDYILAFTRTFNLNPNCFYGVPEGATKIGLFTQYKWAQQSPGYTKGSHVLPMGRGKAKEHGLKDNRGFLGKPSGRTVVLEDVTTTGSSLLATVDLLQQNGIEVVAAFGLTNRMLKTAEGEAVATQLLGKRVSYHALSNITELLPLAYLTQRPVDSIIHAVEEEFRRYGTKEVRVR